VSPQLEGIGAATRDCNEAELLDEPTPQSTHGVAAYALDRRNAERLWKAVEDLTAPS